jgi:hypothetical protein
MAKKSLINGFKFQKLPEISNGLMIPVGNEIKAEKVQLNPEPRGNVVKPQTVHNFRKLEIDSQAFTPMTNVVPTIQSNSVPTNKPVNVPEKEPKFKGLSRKAKQRITREDLNLEEFGILKTKQEKITYLALRGWSLKVQRRGNGFYHYATLYVKRKKKSMYLGSINEDM